jgi:AcrR family transcriptional regulator
MASERREHLVHVARDLFAQHGFHGTGIDTILRQAGVSKKTLYKHFRSKDELILAVLKQHDSEFRNHFMRSVEASSADPRERLLSIFNVAADWFNEPGFFGCIFINAIGEYSEEDTQVRAACRDFKRQIRSFIVELAKTANATDPDCLGDQLALLLEGAIVTAQVSDRKQSARTARRAAETLIEHAF